MKKESLWVLLCTALAMCFFTSCSKDETAKDSIETIEAVTEIPEEYDGLTGTRTTIYDTAEGGIELWWGAKESIGVYGTRLTNKKFTGTNKYKDAASTYFSGATLLSSPKYAYYPYRQENDGKKQTAVEGNIPVNQTYSTAVRRLNYDYKVGKYASWSLSGTKFSFENIITFLRLKLDASGTALEGDKLSYIRMEVADANGKPRMMSGNFTFDITQSGANAITAWEVAEGTNVANLSFVDQPELDAGKVIEGFLTVAPKMQSGDVIKFTVKTDKHIATFNRTSKLAYTPNKIVKYTLTLATVDGLVIEEIPPYEPEQPEVTEIDLTLKSFKFEVSKNQGKILSRELKWNTSTKATEGTAVTEKKADIDQDSKTITLFIPYLNNRKLVPTFEVAEGAVVMTDTGVEIDGVNEVDFTGVKQIGVVNPTSGDAYVYNLELTNTGLPVVVVNQVTGTTSTEATSDYQKASEAWFKATQAKWVPKNADWPEPDAKTDNFMVYNADGTSALTDKNGAAVEAGVASATRIRGNVTQQMPKKAFAVKLDKKSGVLGMPAHKRWVLLANWKDRTLMRNEVAFGLAKVFKQTFPTDGMAWNPSGQHVELVYNGVHVGNYYLCEQIKIDEGRLNISEPYDVEDNNDTSKPEAFGYLMENDDGAESEGDPYFFTNTSIPFIFKDDVDAGGVLKNYVQTLTRSVDDYLYTGYSRTGTTATNAFNNAFKNIEMTSFVDFLLVQELMLNSEAAAPKSCYMYIENGIFHAGPVWDFDWNTLPTTKRFENSNYSYTKTILTGASVKRSTKTQTGDSPYVWYAMLIKNSTFKSLITTRWDKVKGALQAYAATIPATAQKIAKSADVNDDIWHLDKYEDGNGSHRGSLYGIGGDWPNGTRGVTRGYCGDEGMTFDAACTNLKDLLIQRINGLDQVY